MQFWTILTEPDTTAIVGFVVGIAAMIFWRCSVRPDATMP